MRLIEEIYSNTLVAEFTGVDESYDHSGTVQLHRFPKVNIGPHFEGRKIAVIYPYRTTNQNVQVRVADVSQFDEFTEGIRLTLTPGTQASGVGETDDDMDGGFVAAIDWNELIKTDEVQIQIELQGGWDPRCKLVVFKFNPSTVPNGVSWVDVVEHHYQSAPSFSIPNFYDGREFGFSHSAIMTFFGGITAAANGNPGDGPGVGSVSMSTDPHPIAGKSITLDSFAPDMEVGYFWLEDDEALSPKSWGYSGSGSSNVVYGGASLVFQWDNYALDLNGPADETVHDGFVATFHVEIVAGETPFSYQWYQEGVGILSGETTDTLSFTAYLADSGNRYYCEVTDLESTVESRHALLTVIPPPPPPPPRSALVYNFEDDNYTWMDAAADIGGVLEPAICMRYQFDPGWVVRWEDLAQTWADLEAAGTTWADMYHHGDEENLYWLTQPEVMKSDQIIRTDTVKAYFAERTHIDLDDLVTQWTTNKWKHLRQFYFHMQSPLDAVGSAPNLFEAAVGWSPSLMDAPNYKPWDTINLQKSADSGVHKWDFRATGRYLAIKFRFDATQSFKFTGGDLDAEEAHGR